jgi:hypothetical protein
VKGNASGGLALWAEPTCDQIGFIKMRIADRSKGVANTRRNGYLWIEVIWIESSLSDVRRIG